MIFFHVYYVDVGKCIKCFSRLNVFVLTPPTTHWKTLASFSAKVHFSRHKAFLLKAKSGKDCTVSKVKKLNIKSMSCEICVCVCWRSKKYMLLCCLGLIFWIFGILLYTFVFLFYDDESLNIYVHKKFIHVRIFMHIFAHFNVGRGFPCNYLQTAQNFSKDT